ncbi:LOW QUALITY PROTEIN: E3 ubiquitin-protein ligase bre1 [Podospora pseudoanserina]|uniref:E3 ubiquitin protein ligase n=1 Tax=Podospora pseudoanserina TaxID=2609844 RepID=A0ABR0HKV9_9PEZI|nr:LOW QUALITY PROTEIN: E3 ubiquitin-protein ligase bre1 [Podospora pseudoanserina]
MQSPPSCPAKAETGLAASKRSHLWEFLGELAVERALFLSCLCFFQFQTRSRSHAHSFFPSLGHRRATQTPKPTDPDFHSYFTLIILIFSPRPDRPFPLAFASQKSKSRAAILMPVATSPSALPRPSSFAKMEDRKRPASGAVDEVAPPSKRHQVNGSGKSKDDSGDMKEEAWIEEYTKGAIYRQMQEYKREKASLESRVQELEKNHTDHDDHIRVVDAWLHQSYSSMAQYHLALRQYPLLTLLDSPFPSSTALGFKDSKEFQRHLGDKGKAFKSKAESIFQRLASSRGEVKPDVAKLESQLKTALAQQKELHLKLDRLESDKALLSEQYDQATLKAIKAERKLDRVRSVQVQKLEQKALASATTRPVKTEENGDSSDDTDGNTSELRALYKEAQAVVNRQKLQIEAIISENKALMEENSTFKTKRESVSDEDYVRTDVFKHFKLQNEDLIKRINHLEATNKQLREEAEKLRAERSDWQVKVEAEAQLVVSEAEDQIQAKDQDLTRIRAARDDLVAELAMRKAAQDQERAALDQMKELVNAKMDRITQLESELERLRPSEDVVMTDAQPNLESLSIEELRAKCAKLEKDYASINAELPLLEKSYKKAMVLAHSKTMDNNAVEERINTLMAEKAKADQKYFAARKDMDIRLQEIRTLRSQNSRSSEIIAQLKDVEHSTRSVISNLEKQIATLKTEAASMAAEKKRLELLTAEATRRADSVKGQIANLTELLKAKDATVASMKEQTMSREQELDKIKARLEEKNSEISKLRAKCRGNSTDEEEALRNLVICSVCRSNFKNTILKGCGHVFCNSCVDDRLANRMRKCPSCNKAFDRSDAMAAHL